MYVINLEETMKSLISSGKVFYFYLAILGNIFFSNIFLQFSNKLFYAIYFLFTST